MFTSSELHGGVLADCAIGPSYRVSVWRIYMAPVAVRDDEVDEEPHAVRDVRVERVGHLFEKVERDDAFPESHQGARQPQTGAGGRVDGGEGGGEVGLVCVVRDGRVDAGYGGEGDAQGEPACDSVDALHQWS